MVFRSENSELGLKKSLLGSARSFPNSPRSSTLQAPAFPFPVCRVFPFPAAVPRPDSSAKRAAAAALAARARLFLPSRVALTQGLEELGFGAREGVLISFLQNFRKEMKGWVRVSSSPLGREVFRNWERMKMRVILVDNYLCASY